MGEFVRLTVKERILLHLLPYGKFVGSLEVPIAVAQEGIAVACWITQRHLSQYLRPLMQRGLLRERKAHVEGVRQRRKVYELTESGKLAAIRLRKKVVSSHVRVRDDGNARDVTVAAVLSEVKQSVTPLEVVRLAIRAEPIRLEDLEGPPRPQFLDMVVDAPQIEGFVGRSSELEVLTEDAGGRRLYVIRGVAGIGKSSLAAKACELLRGKRNLFWHRVRAWDSRDSILSRLGAFLAALGRPGLRAVLMRGQAERAAEVFREDLPGTQSFLVFDDAHQADPQLHPFFRLLIDALARAEDVRALILTRTALPFYSRRDVVLRGLVEELELQGLESHEVAAYLSDHQLPEEAFEVAQSLHGHPLFLELLRAHNPFSGALVDVRRYLEEEVYADLPDAERGMMKVASLYQVPVPRDALLADPDWPHDVVLALANRFLLRHVGQNRFEAHDTIRSFFAELLTPAEMEGFSAFAVENLRSLGSEAREAEEFARSSSYLANAVQLSTNLAEQASLWEALGDVSQRLGDLVAVSIAYRSAAKLGGDAESKARAHRKMAIALEEWGDSAGAAEEAQAGLEALGETHGLEWGWLHLARSGSLVGAAKIPEARADVETALAVFRDSKDQDGEAQALIQLVNVLGYSPAPGVGEATARECLARVLDLAGALDDPGLSASAHTWMTRVIAAEGAGFDEVSEHFAAAEALYEAMENYRIRLVFLDQRAAFHGAFDGDFEARAADCKELIRLAKQVRSDSDVVYGTYLLAFVSLVNGDVHEARHGYEEAAEAWRRYGNFRMYENALFHVGRCCLMEGDAKGFSRVRAESESSAVKEGGGFPLYPTLYRTELRALDRLIKGDLQGSRELFEEILRNLKRLQEEKGGVVFELPRTHSIYAAALRAVGHEREAEEHLRLARGYNEAWHRAGSLVELEADVPRLTHGLQRILNPA